MLTAKSELSDKLNVFERGANDYLAKPFHIEVINHTNEDIDKNNLAHEQNKCVIIVTHSQNVCNLVDKVYELKRN